ncbi:MULTISPECIES: DUF4381 domain-containing protein [Rheinheimera]|uniref:DUF4381 domain-containing protein n=1 Tax=Rheinheimera marina TaxID=1774958 RepID=A0ABV9JQ61_9GAMM
MAAEPALQLADISEPALATFWPPAPLWWGLAFFLLLAVGWLVRRQMRQRQKQLALRQARAEWAALSASQSAELNQLLKRLVKHYQPTHPALFASVSQWQQLLQSLTAQPLPDLQHLLYQPQPAAELQQQFYHWAGELLRQLKVQQLESLCSN